MILNQILGIVLHACLVVSQITVDVTFRNKAKYYFDVDGNAIHSTNGKIDWINGTYFWIAQQFGTSHLSMSEGNIVLISSYRMRSTAVRHCFIHFSRSAELAIQWSLQDFPDSVARIPLTEISV
jgi:hypothetical protein